MDKHKLNYSYEDMEIEITSSFSEYKPLKENEEKINVSLKKTEENILTLKIDNVPETPNIPDKQLIKAFAETCFNQIRDLYLEFQKKAEENGTPSSFKAFKELLFKDNTDINKKEKIINIPRTKSAHQFVIAKSKVTNSFFKGDLETNGEQNVIGVEKRGAKNFIDTIVTVNFENMPNLYMSRDISIYDRIVHDAVTSLSVTGGNEYITPLMIYRTMTGNPKAAPKKEQLQKVSESIRALSRIRILIQAEGEKNRYGLQKSTYEGNLLATEIVRGKHNGKEEEWIHLLRSPVLYDYSSQRIKQQVSRTDIKLLNTPINKNVEKMELQYYLLQRIETIKNSHAKTSKRILFESIYEVLKVEAPNPKALSKKQTNIRDAAITILDYWKKEKFIKNYSLIKKGRSVVAIDIID